MGDASVAHFLSSTLEYHSHSTIFNETQPGVVTNLALLVTER